MKVQNGRETPARRKKHDLYEFRDECGAITMVSEDDLDKLQSR